MNKPEKNPLIHEDLAAAQLIILEALSAHATASEIHQAVDQSALPHELKQWLLSSDPNMLETAAQLVKKWQSKDPKHAVGLNERQEPQGP